MVNSQVAKRAFYRQIVCDFIFFLLPNTEENFLGLKICSLKWEWIAKPRIVFLGLVGIVILRFLLYIYIYIFVNFLLD